MSLQIEPETTAPSGELCEEQLYPYKWLDGQIRPVKEPLPWSHEWTGSYGGRPFGRLRARNGRLIAPYQHVRRFVRSCDHMKIDLSWDEAELITAIMTICQANEVIDGYIDIEGCLPIKNLRLPMAGHGIYKRDVRQGVVKIEIWKLDEYLEEGAPKRGIRCYLSPQSRPGHIPAGIKIGAYELARYWKAIAEEMGYDEVIFPFRDEFGNWAVADASAAEVIVKLRGEKDICRIVPNQHGILGGITRDIADEILRKDYGQTIIQEPIHWQYLIGEKIDGMAVVGTAILVVPVCSIFNPEGNCTYQIGDGQPHPLMVDLGHRIREIFAPGDSRNYQISRLFVPIAS